MTYFPRKDVSIRTFDAATGAEVARLNCPEAERFYSVTDLSAGGVVAIGFGGKKGAPRELLFRDARTLADRGRFVAPPTADDSWATGRFTPDGTRFLILSGSAEVQVWDVAAGK